MKRLEIYGFKSFADKCTIHFPPGVCAIVGPNGCGKSNIIDAIKWVMGEQSVKQLRGKAMGDVIFSGTDKKTPVNMAEVSLTLSGISEHGPDPLRPYSEIMVTRRLYRSGESHYLINKQPCRLKDVHDVFMRYGMGSRSCAIIQQGNIGAITEATAEERRTFIEEAAGVVRYKARRQEAVSKVHATRQNLARINDILDEIETQLVTLAEEAEKARQYKEARDRLKQADILITVYYYEDYAKRIAESEALLKRLREKDALGAETLAELNDALARIESRRQRKEEEIAALRAQKSEKQRVIDRLESNLRYLQNELTRLGEEISGLNRSVEEVSAKNRKIDGEIDAAREKSRALQNKIQSIESSLGRRQSLFEEDRARLASLKKQREEQKNRQMELSATRARYQNICQHAAANMDQLKRRLRQVKTDKRETEKKIAELEQSEAAQKKRLEALREKRDALGRQKADCQDALRERSGQLNEQVRTVQALSNERARLKSKLGVLERMEANFEWYRDGVRAVMKAGAGAEKTANPGRAGLMEIVADIVEPEPGYEHAVEAALGEALQYIVIEDIEAGLKAVAYLKESKAGRSGFIPADICGAGFAESAPHEKIGRLRRYIRVRPGFEGVLDALIGDVGVAGDLEAALDAVQAGNPFGSVVTRNGDMVLRNGVLVGGSPDRLAGILEKKHEIRQLRQRLAETDAHIESAEEQKAELESGVRELENRVAAMVEKNYQYETELVEADKALYKTGEQLRQARQQLELAALEEKRLLGEQQDIHQELASHDTALSEISADLETTGEHIRELNARIEEQDEKIKAVEKEQMDLKLDRTRHAAELENAQQTVKRLRQFKQEGEERLETLQREAKQKQQQIEEARDRISGEKERLEAEKQALEALRQQLQSEQSDYQNLSGRRKQTDTSICRTQNELEQTRQKIHQLELDLSGLHINQENLVNRFLEKYPESFARIRSQHRDWVARADFSIEKAEKERLGCKQQIDGMGEVNLGAIEAHEAQKARYDFLAGHRDDLVEALSDLENVIRKINRITRRLFVETFDAINEKFSELFPKLFSGGAAWMELTEPDKPLETGVELMIHPPGKKVSRLSLLSGGEKALSAIAFIFAIFLLNPAAFCLLDEIDAPLDDINIERFNELLRIIGEKTQIIMITHNKKTMEFSDVLFGVTMAGSGVSRVISVNMEEAMKINARPGKSGNGKRTDHATAIH